MEKFQGASLVVLDTFMIEKYENRGIEARLVQLLKEMISRKRITSFSESTRETIADRTESPESTNDSNLKLTSNIDVKNKSEKENKNDNMLEFENTNKSTPGHWSLRNMKQINPPASLAMWQTLVLSTPAPFLSSAAVDLSSETNSDRNKILTMPNLSTQIRKKVVRFSSQNQFSDEQKNIECE